MSNAEAEETPLRGPNTRSRISSTGRRGRRRCRRHSSEIILVESTPVERPNPPPRQRLRLLDAFEANSTIIDLTCADDYVDLTVPSPEADRIIEISSVEINDDEFPTVGPESTNDSTNEANSQPTLFCPVCLEKYSKIVKEGGQLKSTTCGHVFCQTCITTAIFHSKKCPTCRKRLDSRKIHNLYLSL